MHVAHMRTAKGYQNCVFVTKSFAISVLVLNSTGLYTLYGAPQGQVSKHLLYPEFHLTVFKVSPP